MSGGIDVPIAIGIDWLSASGHVGYQWIADNPAYGTPDWVFFDFGVTATWNIFAFDVRYIGTDLDKANVSAAPVSAERRRAVGDPQPAVS